MLTKKQTEPAPVRVTRDPFDVMRRVFADFDRPFGEWPTFRWPAFPVKETAETSGWYPEIDVFEKDNRLVAKVDLPGLTKEDVKVEVTDGYLAVSGERKTEAEEKKEGFYRCERQYGTFYRTVPLPEGVKLEDVKATFADGVLEVSVPMPATPASKVLKVEVKEAPKVAKTAA